MQIFIADLSGMPYMRVSTLSWRGVVPPGEAQGPADVGAFRCVRVPACVSCLLIPPHSCATLPAALLLICGAAQPDPAQLLLLLLLPPHCHPLLTRHVPPPAARSWPLPNSSRAAFFLDATNSLFIAEFRRPQVGGRRRGCALGREERPGGGRMMPRWILLRTHTHPPQIITFHAGVRGAHEQGPPQSRPPTSEFNTHT